MAHNPELRILVISALADKATGIEALEKGARGFCVNLYRAPIKRGLV